MDIRRQSLIILEKYWWVLFIFIGVGFFLTDIPIFKFITYLFAFIIGLSIFLPFILRIFTPLFFLIATLIQHFQNDEGMSFGKKYFVIPMALLALSAFLAANLILSIWVAALSFIIWASLIGSFWTIILAFVFGLAPLGILLAPFLIWHKLGFVPFLNAGIFYLITAFWVGFLTLISSNDYRNIPENIIGYSPYHFLLGAISFQVIALPFYKFEMYEAGNYIAGLGGTIFLLLTIITAIKWWSVKRKLSKMETDDSYQPSVWVYILGFLATNFISGIFLSHEAPTTVLSWLNLYFMIILISSFLRFLVRKIKEIGARGKVIDV